MHVEHFISLWKWLCGEIKRTKQINNICWSAVIKSRSKTHFSAPNVSLYCTNNRQSLWIGKTMMMSSTIIRNSRGEVWTQPEVGLQRFDSMHRKSITDPSMRFSILSVRFSIRCLLNYWGVTEHRKGLFLRKGKSLFAKREFLTKRGCLCYIYDFCYIYGILKRLWYVWCYISNRYCSRFLKIAL